MSQILDIAENYYTQMGAKNLEKMEQYLHPDVKFKSPLSEIIGKENLLSAISGFFSMFEFLRDCLLELLKRRFALEVSKKM